MSYSIIKDYTNSRGKTHQAHFSPSGKYLGPVSKRGDKPFLLVHAKPKKVIDLPKMFQFPEIQDKPVIIEDCDSDTDEDGGGLTTDSETEQENKEYYFDTGVWQNIMSYVDTRAKKSKTFDKGLYVASHAGFWRLGSLPRTYKVVGRTKNYLKMIDPKGKPVRRIIKNMGENHWMLKSHPEFLDVEYVDIDRTHSMCAYDDLASTFVSKKHQDEEYKFTDRVWKQEC